MHITPGKQDANVDRGRYNAMRKAVLEAVPKSRSGVAFKDLPGLVKPHFPIDIVRNASITWYTVAVKLDLKSRDAVDRVMGASPQRLCRR